MSYIASLWYLCKLSLCWIGTPINIRSLIKWWQRFDVIDGSWFRSAWNLYHTCHITNTFYRHMMHVEDERPPNGKSHAYHFSIAYNGCDFCLLTPSAIFALPNAYLKDGVWNFVVSFALDPVLVIATEIDRHCTKMSTKKMRNTRNC